MSFTFNEFNVVKFFRMILSYLLVLGFVHGAILSPNGRVVNANNPVMKFDERDDAFTPRILNGSQASVYGRIDLSSIWAKASAEVWFTIEQRFDVMIKYVHDCICPPNEDGGCHRAAYHPIVREGRLMSLAANHELSYLPVILSPPGLLRNLITDLPYQLSGNQLASCARNLATVRYMVVKVPRVVRVLSNIPRPMDPSRALVIGAMLIKALKKLHGLNIVHGALSMESVEIQQTAQEPRAIFHYFSQSIILNKTGDEFMTRKVADQYMSPFELQNGRTHKYTKADDVYRALEIVGRLMNTKEYESVASILLETRELSEWKRRANIFGIPFMFFVSEGLTMSDPLRDAIQSKITDPANLERADKCTKLLLLSAKYRGEPDYDRMYVCLIWLGRNLRAGNAPVVDQQSASKRLRTES